MKKILPAALAFALLGTSSFGQVVQQLKRARELNNQNNVRQGVPPPSSAQRPAAPVNPATAQPLPTVAKPTATTAQQGISKIQADIAALKPGTPATAEQKQQLIKDLAFAVRGTKPSLPVVSTFATSLLASLTDNTLGSPEQGRLAQNIEAVLNSAGMPAKRYDDTIADVQAILQVGGAKRNVAAETANSLKAVGAEVRRK